MPPRLLIATPTYDQSVASPYAESVVNAIQILLRRKIVCNYITADGADVAAARNAMASFFWNNKAATHLLFADSDMKFEPRLVERLLSLGVPVAGCVYPKRKIDLAEVMKAARANADDALALAAAQQYVVFHGKEVAVKDGCCKVDSLGMGLCLIERCVFGKILEKCQIRRYRNAPFQHMAGGEVFGFFDDIDGHSEDVSFCKRWTGPCGGEIVAIIDEPIGHVGRMTYTGRYLDRLNARFTKAK